MRLEGKVAIVTGAGSGFGKGIAERFVAEGAVVVVGDIDTAAAASVAQSLEGRAVAVTADVATADGNRALVNAAVDRFGRLDCFIANAGFSHANKPMTEVAEEEFDRIFAVNVKGVFLGAQAAIPALEAAGGGTILVTASTAGLRPRPGLTWYNASKGAAITASKSMAVELAPKNIRVNALCPVIGETGMTALFLGQDTPERRAQFAGTIPLGRFSTPDDMAAAACFLASDEASFLTGLAMEVDGGRCV